jgi:hypothetical protein
MNKKLEGKIWVIIGEFWCKNKCSKGLELGIYKSVISDDVHIAFYYFGVLLIYFYFFHYEKRGYRTVIVG